MQPYNDYRAKSFWLEQASANYIENPPLEGTARADVVIIGGGFTGVSTAYHLKKTQPGLRVMLLESDVIGYGASGRNGGFAMTLFGLTLGITALRFGKQRAREAHAYMERAVTHVGDLVRDNQINCDYEYNGFLRVANTPTYARRIQAEMALAHSLGIEGVDWIDGRETRALIDSPTYLGAWREPHCALVQPAKLVRGMKQAAIAAGAEIYEHSPVTQIEFEPRVRVQTAKGAIEAEKLVLATNAFSSEFPQLRAKQCPVYTYIVLTEPLTAAQLGMIGWRGRQGVEDARNFVHYYRLTADNRLLMGGGDVLYFYGNRIGVDQHAPTFEHLERFLVETFPGLRGVRVTHRWGGPVSAPLDMAPAIGYVGPSKRTVYSLGCMGHGVSLAHLNGQTLSDLVLERKTDLTDVFFVGRKIIPLPPEPVRFPVARGILGIMRAQDTFDERKGLGEN